MTALVMAKAAKNADPIQNLFVEKLQEYKKKSTSAGDSLVDMTAEMKAKNGSGKAANTKEIR